MRSPTLLAAVAATLLHLPSPSAAQIRASEPASVTQTIDGTEITIEYYRPRARGRTPLFGPEAVVWENPWTPGANWSTNIAFENPITLQGVALEPGEYSMWIRMSEDGFLPESMFLDPNPKIFHTQPPPASDEQIEIPIERSEGPFKEVLTWDFEDISSTGAVLALRWGNMRIPLEVGVEPSMRLTVTPEEAAPVVGTYRMQFHEGPTGPGSPPFTFIVRYDEESETLRGDIEEFPDPWFNSLDMQLLPFADRIFVPGEVYDGVLTEVWDGFFMEFELTDGPSDGIQLRGEEDAIVGEAERVG